MAVNVGGGDAAFFDKGVGSEDFLLLLRGREGGEVLVVDGVTGYFVADVVEGFDGFAV